MSENTCKDCPWKDGIYVMQQMKCMLFKVNGTKCDTYNYTYLDYPEDALPMGASDWISGKLKQRNYRQQPSPLLYSIGIWPAHKSRLTQRETNN